MTTQYAKTKLYFVTDAHLGSGADSLDREKQLVQWLDMVANDAAKIIFLGDMFDFWFSYRHVVPRGHVRFLGKLAELTDHGIELHFFIGNHDMWLFDYLSKETGMIMHSQPETMEWDNKLFMLGHGDGVGAHEGSYNFLKHVFRNRICQKLFATIHPYIGFSVARKWSEKSRQSHDKIYNDYLGDDKECIVQYCLQQQAERARQQLKPIDFFLFGHRHCAVHRKIANIDYTNVGNWLTDRDYVVYECGNIELKQFDATL